MEKRLKEIFSQTLQISQTEVKDELEYQSIEEWDSVNHMSLVAAIDENFGISLNSEEAGQLSSFKKAKEILEKYGKYEKTD